MKRLLTAMLFGALLPAQQAQPQSGPQAWPAAIVDRFETIAVQDDGRVKPLRTYAAFALLRMHGARALSMAAGRLSPIEWMLDVLFRPELAHTQPVFRIENDEVLDAIGAAHEGKRKRDRYSYRELERHRERCFALGRQYGQIESGLRTPVQQQTVMLAHNLAQYEDLTGLLEFARRRLTVPADSPTLQKVLGSGEVRFSRVVRELDRIIEAFHASDGTEMSEADRAELRRVSEFLGQVERLSHAADALMWLPPEEAERREWMTFHDVLAEPAGPARDRRLEILEDFEALTDVVGDMPAFDQRSATLHAHLKALAEARGEYSKIGLEVFFYELDPFTYALGFYLLAFVVCMVGWMRTRSRPLWGVAWALTVVPTVLLIGGIVIRCILRSRPPVSTLYETILFITASIALVAFVIEWVNRRRIGLTLAAFLGVVGMFIARKHEEIEGTDTMPTLLAVLDTNFWLSTHVTTVTLGYAAGLLAAAIAHIYVLGRLFGWRRDDAPFYRAIARMVYGVICFGLLFSVVGTILGGVWANDSWGRFWGWDPKENGALMICLWEIAMLHARMGGYLKDFGFCLASIFGGIVVAFSWWGVNLLGIGLHSYGFTSGISLALNIFYGSQLVVLGLGAVVMWQERRDLSQSPSESGA